MIALENLFLFILDLLAFFAVYLIISSSLNIQFGFAGIPNFGLVFAVAGGAYTVGALSVIVSSFLFNVNISEVDIIKYNSLLVSQINVIIEGNPLAGISLLLVLILIAAVVGAVLGFISSVPAVRLREDYLGITLLVFGEVITAIAVAYTPLIGGPHGVRTPDVWIWASDYRYIASTGTILVFALLAYSYSYYLSKTPLGRVLKAMRDSEVAATSLGKNVPRYRLMIVIIGAVLCSIAGALYALYIQSVTPTYIRFTWTFLPWVMVLLGGKGSNMGTLFGTLVFITINKLIVYYKFLFVGILPFDVVWLNFILLGVVLILIIMYRPQGLIKEKPILQIKRKRKE
ncbi:MAG: branched-chain amino acid ABC transporter permease [Candidatus Bathyarchaeia archaeon]